MKLKLSIFLTHTNDTKELQKESSIIKMHNDKYISQHLVSEKDYLDRILRECDSAILLDNEQREVVLSDEDHTLVMLAQEQERQPP